jgi:Zn-dependent protease
MRDPFTWSLPLYSAFGIKVRMHVLFPVVAVGLILRASVQKEAPPGIWWEETILMGLLFLSVLLHEYGHCLGARLVDGDAHEILLWPLGGLAAVEVPHTARANFITAAFGPLANVFLCCAAAAALAFFGPGLRPPFSPLWNPTPPLQFLYTWSGVEQAVTGWPVLLARFFWVNWVLFLFNMILVGFPMDAGRLLQCALWPRLGFGQATRVAVFAGFITMICVGIFSIVSNEVLLLCLALFIYITCRQQYFILENGGEESLFGYDFSQGYTSLERDQPPPARRKPSFFKRWLQNRAKRRMERQQEQREAEERRMDILLDKVQREGLQALTDEEHRFLTRVSARYRNRQ